MVPSDFRHEYYYSAETSTHTLLTFRVDSDHLIIEATLKPVVDGGWLETIIDYQQHRRAERVIEDNDRAYNLAQRWKQLP